MKSIYQFFIAGVIVAATAACGQSKQAATNGNSTTAGPNKSSGYQSVSFSRTGCFGRCPTYTVTVERSGLVRYVGQRFVQYEGTYERTISPKQADRLIHDFEEKRVDTCQDKYDMHVADIPGLNFTTILASGAKKQITHAHFGPMFLKELARRLDEVAKVDASWKKTSADNGTQNKEDR